MADILCDTRYKMGEYPKIIILTHADADGLVAAMIVKLFEEIEDKNKTFLIMSSMDVTLAQTDKTFNYICNYTSLGKRDKVYILDRPIPSVEWLKMQYLSYTNIINIDHHLTNHPSFYKDEDCCKNIEFVWDDKVSAAYLTLEYFNKLKENSENVNTYKKLYDKLKPLTEATSLWDTFQWKNLGSSQEHIKLKKRALSINSAEKILGSEAFYRFIVTRVNSNNYTEEVFNYFTLLDEAYNLKMDSVYNFTKRAIYTLPFKKYKLGVVYGIEGDYQSLIADKIFADKKMDYDIVAFLNIYGTVSFRSKNDIDVSEIAKKMGDLVGFSGGGHKNASGCRIFDRDEVKKKLIETFEQLMQKI
ncbi:MAG: DHHA1 domain-containing protein [Fusobacterium sp.]|uniref:DHHA1 domain-containing protein n=1 Tax=Fusobacterium sp. TaxID=68766 RepID=UPI0026DCEFCF|nr:DHHA1 domain-containing protein [Fusobacterium sp.]MDO4691149.1 DHHA1 domain-containing protein [Fusobacterium sp.]